jgi:hypothetical protein
MGGKSDTTKFAAELPLLLVFVNQGQDLPENFQSDLSWIDKSRLSNCNSVIQGIEYALPIACIDGGLKFKKNYKEAQITFKAVCEYFAKLGIVLPVLFYWQATEKDKDSTDPTDISFVGHQYAGISVKNEQAPNLKNHGVGKVLKDVVASPRQRGQDYFDWISESTLSSVLIKNVVGKMLDNLSTNTAWSDTGKYSILCETPDRFTITNNKKSKTFTRKQLTEVSMSKGWLRVFGDWYQDKNKSQFMEERKLVDSKIRPILRSVVKDKIITNPDYYSSLGAFSTLPYLFVTSDGKIYEVPSFDNIINELVMEVQDESSESGMFGAGIKFVCSIRKKGHTHGATVDVHFRYHQGTFASTVVFMVQNLQNKEQIWTQIV